MIKENFMTLQSLINMKTLVICALEEELKTVTDTDLTKRVRSMMHTIQSENKILGRIIKTEKIE